jgi:hypothetical protein
MFDQQHSLFLGFWIVRRNPVLALSLSTIELLAVAELASSQKYKAPVVLQQRVKAGAQIRLIARCIFVNDSSTNFEGPLSREAGSDRQEQDRARA